VDQFRRGHVQAAPLQDIELDRHVLQVKLRFLHAGAGFDLADAPAVFIQAFQNVHADADTVVLEGRLENGGHGRVGHQFPRSGNCLLVPPRRIFDLYTPGKQIVSPSADPGSDLNHGARFRGAEGKGIVNVEPKFLVAAQPRQELGFRKM